MGKASWCEHIFWKEMQDDKTDASTWMYKRPDNAFEGIVPAWWSFCPLCGKKKP